jgi:hypothetical protein
MDMAKIAMISIALLVTIILIVKSVQMRSCCMLAQVVEPFVLSMYHR